MEMFALLNKDNEFGFVSLSREAFEKKLQNAFQLWQGMQARGSKEKSFGDFLGKRKIVKLSVEFLDK